MRLTCLLFAFCAAAVVSASPRTVRTDTVTTPSGRNDGVVSTLAGIAQPVGLVNVGENGQERTTTTTTTTSRRRKMRRLISNSPQPPMNLERLTTLSFAAAQGEGKQAENFIFKAAKQADQDLGMSKAPAVPQAASQPPNVPGQAPKTASAATSEPQQNPSSNDAKADFVDAST